MTHRACASMQMASSQQWVYSKSLTRNLRCPRCFSVLWSSVQSTHTVREADWRLTQAGEKTSVQVRPWQGDKLVGTGAHSSVIHVGKSERSGRRFKMCYCHSLETAENCPLQWHRWLLQAAWLFWPIRCESPYQCVSTVFNIMTMVYTITTITIVVVVVVIIIIIIIIIITTTIIACIIIIGIIIIGHTSL